MTVHGPVQIFFGNQKLHPICVQSSQVPASWTLKTRQDLIWRWLTAPPGPFEVIQNSPVSRPHIGEVFEGPREEFLVFLMSLREPAVWQTPGVVAAGR
jgi:hypothetical protein